MDDNAVTVQYAALTSFPEATIRRAFARKVFAILFCQLMITTGLIALVLYVEEINKWIRDNLWTLVVAGVITVVLVITLNCCMNIRRRYPLNLILLPVFTICEGVILGVPISSDSHFPYYAMIAIGIGAVVCVGLILFTLQTKFDFTMLSGSLIVIFSSLSLFGILVICIPGDVERILYSALVTIAVSCYCVHDVQLLMGGKHIIAISHEDYILAALSLHVDIFTWLLIAVRRCFIGV